MKFTLSRPRQSQDPESDLDFVPILPLLTTKRVFLRAVVTELLWFISGSTSAKPLQEAGIHIWDGNGSREYLDSVGLSHRAEGDLGPVYGFQWRHFGAQYQDAQTDYAGQGVDQLAEVVRKLCHSPYDRRIIMSAWNPAALKEMALPPCHMFAQFYVSFPSVRRGAKGGAQSAEPSRREDGTERGVLSCHLYQRSCDMGLGIPFNIASYALLTHMLAFACDLIPGTLTHSMGDAHVYADHVDALEEQIVREPREFPTLDVQREVEGDASKRRGAARLPDVGVKAIENWKLEELAVVGYKPHASVKMKMSV
jgi:thymidylate synthase